MKTLTTTAILFLTLVSIAHADGLPTRQEVHKQMFSMTKTRLELINGVVYGEKSGKPYTGTVTTDGNDTFRYVDGVLERIEFDKVSGLLLSKDIYVNGLNLVRYITYNYESERIFDEEYVPPKMVLGERYTETDRFEINGRRFSTLLRERDSGSSSVAIPDIEELGIEPSGFVDSKWHPNGQMLRGLRYVGGKCCLSIIWTADGQTRRERKYADVLEPGDSTKWVTVDGDTQGN